MFLHDFVLHHMFTMLIIYMYIHLYVAVCMLVECLLACLVLFAFMSPDLCLFFINYITFFLSSHTDFPTQRHFHSLPSSSLLTF